MINFNLWPQCDPELVDLPILTWNERAMFELNHEDDGFNWLQHIYWPTPMMIVPRTEIWLPPDILMSEVQG